MITRQANQAPVSDVHACGCRCSTNVEHLQEMALVQHDHVVEPLPAERPDDSLCHRVSVWGMQGRHDRRDPDARGAVNEVLAVTAVVVANEIPGLCAPGRPSATTCRQIHCAVGCRVTLTWLTRRRPCAMKTSTYAVGSMSVCTVNRSTAQIADAWLRRTCASSGRVGDGAHAGDSGARCVR